MLHPSPLLYRVQSGVANNLSSLSYVLLTPAAHWIEFSPTGEKSISQLSASRYVTSTSCIFFHHRKWLPETEPRSYCKVVDRAGRSPNDFHFCWKSLLFCLLKISGTENFSFPRMSSRRASPLSGARHYNISVECLLSVPLRRFLLLVGSFHEPIDLRIVQSITIQVAFVYESHVSYFAPSSQAKDKSSSVPVGNAPSPSNTLPVQNPRSFM